MTRRALAIVTMAVAMVGALGSSPAVEARRADVPDTPAQLEFLRHARIVDARPIGKGVTGALRLTLTDGVLTHDAAFQAVNRESRPHDLARGVRLAGETRFVDSFRYNIAAWELARLLPLDGMMPPTVARTYRGQRGALSWWVDDVAMDETQRSRTGVEPPAGQALIVARHRQNMQVFAELVGDTDRNMGNVLYTRDWDVVMIDFTRAFRLQPELRRANVLRACGRELLDRLRGLDAAMVSDAVGAHLTKWEVEALLERRDLIVDRFETLIAERGSAAVLF